VSRPVSDFLAGLTAWAEAGVDYVIVGVAGINFYAQSPAGAFATLDLDALLAPRVGNLRSALAALIHLGYAIEAGGEPFVDVDDEAILQRVIRNGATLTAVRESGGQIDLMHSIAGFSYAELADDATVFCIGDIEVRVGRLENLLASKRASGRPKDLEFLRAFEARASGTDAEEI